MKVLITGSGGMLGLDMYNTFINNCDVIATDIDLNEEWLKYLDVRDYDNCHYMIKKYNPDFVLHLAALTDLEYCEKNENESWITNALGTENIARICKKYDITMVYISTAGVFDGKKDIYNDFDEPNPLNIYGKSKYYGEKIVQNILDKYFIFRAGWMMGGMHKDKKFISQILKQIKNGDDLNVVNDKMGNLTYTLDFSISTLKVIQTNKYGLYNQVCNGNGCSRYEIVKKMKEILKFENTINSVNSEFFKKDYFVNRPYSEKMINLKLNHYNINYMRSWDDCLRDYLDKLNLFK